MKHNKLISLTSIIFSSIILSSCATMFSDSDYPVQVTSNPSDASFKVTNNSGMVVHSGRTPASINLSAKKGYFSSAKYNIVFEKPGYATQTIPFHADLDGWYIANIFNPFGGGIGLLIVDPLTGSMWKLDPIATASLSRSISMKNKDDEIKLHILTLDQIPQNYKDKLVALN